MGHQVHAAHLVDDNDEVDDDDSDTDDDAVNKSDDNDESCVKATHRHRIFGATIVESRS